MTESSWKKSLSCVGCVNSFKDLSDLLDHIRKHLVKLGVFPKGDSHE